MSSVAVGGTCSKEEQSLETTLEAVASAQLIHTGDVVAFGVSGDEWYIGVVKGVTSRDVTLVPPQIPLALGEAHQEDITAVQELMELYDISKEEHVRPGCTSAQDATEVVKRHAKYAALQKQLAEKQAQLSILVKRHHEAEVQKAAVENARKQVRGIKTSEVVELQSYRVPPRAVKRVLEAVLAILGTSIPSHSWEAVQAAVRQPDFLSRIVDFDPRTLSTEVRARLCIEHMGDTLFSTDKFVKASRATRSLTQWVAVQLRFDAEKDISDAIDDKETEEDACEEELQKHQPHRSERVKRSGCESIAVLDARIHVLEEAVRMIGDEIITVGPEPTPAILWYSSREAHSLTHVPASSKNTASPKPSITHLAAPFSSGSKIRVTYKPQGESLLATSRLTTAASIATAASVAAVHWPVVSGDSMSVTVPRWCVWAKLPSATATKVQLTPLQVKQVITRGQLSRLELVAALQTQQHYLASREQVEATKVSSVPSLLRQKPEAPASPTSKQIRALHAEKAKLNKQLAEAQKNREAYRHERDVLAQDLADLQKRTTADVNVAMKQASSLRAALEALQQANATLQREKESLAAMKDQAVAGDAEHAKQQEELQQQLLEQERRSVTDAKQIDDLCVALEALQQANATLQREKESLAAMKDQAAAGDAEHAKQQEELQHQLDAANIHCAALEKQRDALEAARMRAANNETEAVLKMKRSQLAQAEEAAMAKMEQAKAIKELQACVAGAEKRLKKAEDDFQQTKRTHSDEQATVNGELQALRGQLEQQQRDMEQLRELLSTAEVNRDTAMAHEQEVVARARGIVAAAREEFKTAHCIYSDPDYIFADF